ncbi:hypothetical protein [Emticicia sp. W12TSBA100-4]|uniref:hypothetical protein n=1 Tax=Emticicia sp. W12TSBA100-4 TaxID=3160965 RepID=UPI003305E2AD
MIAAIEVVSQITIEVIEDSVLLKGTDVAMGVSPNIDIKQYFDQDEYPNSNGCDMITKVLVSALSGNIKMAHEKGYKNDVVHLRQIIAQLEEMFVIAHTQLIYADEKEVKNG